MSTTSVFSGTAADLVAHLDAIRAKGDRLRTAWESGQVSRGEYDRGRADYIEQLAAFLRDALADCERRGFEAGAVEAREALAELDGIIR